LENEPVPAEFVAATEKVYTSPAVRPVMLQLVDVLEVELGQASLVITDAVVSSAVTV
jgi:hypothetical protein